MGKPAFPPEYDAALFVFPRKTTIPFWMKNCLIPLDVVCIRDDKIVKIYRSCPPCTSDPCTSYPCENIDYVVELLGGTCRSLGIRVGMPMSFE